MAKAYCECINASEWVALWNSVLNQWTDVFVHRKCMKPSKPIWENFLGTCENCYKEFSFPETLYSPWGPYSVLSRVYGDETEGLYVCSRCAPQIGLQPPYRGWKWAGRQRPEWDRADRPETHYVLEEPSSQKPLDNLVALL